MRDYQRVHSSLWTDTKVRSVGEDARWLFVYLLTSPHSNAIGAYLVPDAYIADDLDWPAMRVRKAMEALKTAGLVERFGDGRHIVVCNFLKWNSPENPNTAKAMVKQGMKLPLADPAMRHVLNALETLVKETRAEGEGKDWLVAVVEPFAKAIRTALEAVSNGVRSSFETVSNSVATAPETVSKRVRNKQPEPDIQPDTQPEEQPELTTPLRGEVMAQQTGFDEWWAVYPKKVGKLIAQKAYAGVIKKKLATAEDLLAGLRRYLTSKTVSDGFIKEPVNWLKEGRWADEQPNPTHLIDRPRSGAASAAYGIDAELGLE